MNEDIKCDCGCDVHVLDVFETTEYDRESGLPDVGYHVECDECDAFYTVY